MNYTVFINHLQNITNIICIKQVLSKCNVFHCVSAVRILLTKALFYL